MTLREVPKKDGKHVFFAELEGSPLTLHFDGAARKNPGPVVGCGFQIASSAGLLVTGYHWIVGEKLTNNYAEYSGLGLGLRFLIESPWRGSLFVRGDSLLVVKQLNGEYKVKDERLKKLHARVLEQFQELEMLPATPDEISSGSVDHSFWNVQWVKRDNNDHADSLSNQALDDYATRRKQ